MNRILVAEDEAIIAQDIESHLTRLGYQVTSIAMSSAEVVKAIEASVPDLVLMDIRLRGEVDGIETAKLLKQRWDLPVVFLTAHSDETTVDRAKAVGAHGYLLKPFDERDLRTTVEVAIHKHQLERQLNARERWFSATLASIGDAVLSTDSEFRITYLNGVAERLTGWSMAQALGRPLDEVMQLVDSKGEKVPHPIREALASAAVAAMPKEVRLVPRSGPPLFVDDSAAPVTDAHSRLLGGVVVFRDISEKRRTEQRLAQVERLASLGTLVAGVAHEVNNPLAVMLSNLAFLRENLEGAPELREALADAVNAGDRIKRIVLQLKNLSRRSTEADRELLDLPTVLDAAVGLVSEHLREKATLTRSYGTTPFVEVDEGKLVQVITNLIINAAQAMPAGRTTGNDIFLRTFTDASGQAVVEVRDTGEGISAENLSRIFDPFFTTKPVGVGTGLGLSLCHTYVSEMNGRLGVTSTVGLGSRFTISLPAAQGSPPTQVARPAVAVSATLRVLAIDDDINVGRATMRSLGRSHVVTLESDGAAAVARVASGEEFDVVLCDVMMPGFSGVDVLRELQRIAPALARRFIFMTGGVSGELRRLVETSGVPVLEKPVVKNQLLAAIAALP